MSTVSAAAAITEHETEQIERANGSGRTPVVFVHGLWLLPNSWERWSGLFEDAGYTSLTPGWPDDPETTAEAKAQPEVFARKSIGDVADYLESILRRLERKPAVIGHSFGGLLTQVLAGRGLAAASRAATRLARPSPAGIAPSSSQPGVPIRPSSAV